MDTMKLIVILIMIWISTASCKNQTNINEQEILKKIYRVDVERDIRTLNSLPISLLSKQIEYVPLENNPHYPIRRISDIAVSDSFIFVSDGDKLLLFSRRGEFLRQIGLSGRGPEEYLSISDFRINMVDREIYILSPRKVLIYNFDNQFIRYFTIEFPCNQFILNKSDIIFYPFNIPVSHLKPDYSLYISDSLGNLQYTVKNNVNRVNKGLVIPTSCLYNYNDTLHFMEFGIDTLFSIINKRKIPYAMFNLGKMKMNSDPTISEALDSKGKLWIYRILESDKTMFIKIIWGINDSITNCIFDKTSSKLKILKDNGFINDLDGGPTFWPKVISDQGLLIDFKDAIEFIQLLKNPKFEDLKLKNSEKYQNISKMISQLNDASNPVVIILR